MNAITYVKENAILCLFQMLNFCEKKIFSVKKMLKMLILYKVYENKNTVLKSML